jgi:hypothetical protein
MATSTMVSTLEPEAPAHPVAYSAVRERTWRGWAQAARSGTRSQKETDQPDRGGQEAAKDLSALGADGGKGDSGKRLACLMRAATKSFLSAGGT